MNICPNCRYQIPDGSLFCPVCGTSISAAPQPVQQEVPQYTPTQPANYYPANGYAPYAPKVDPYDHTADFKPEDISENKPTAILIYLLGLIGILIAAWTDKDSAYVRFHVKQAIKLIVSQIIGMLALTVLNLILVLFGAPGLAGILYIAFSICLFVLNILAIVQIIKSKAVEVHLIRKLNFLK